MRVLGSSTRAVALRLSLSSSLMLMPVVKASATDLLAPPGLKDGPVFPVPALWQGFYLGGHIGGAWNSIGVTDHYDYVGDPTSNNSATGSGLIGGAQAGYNFQQGHIVYGLETDLGYLGASGSKSAALTPSPDCLAHYPTNMCGLDAAYSSSGGFYGDITGRLGYAADRALFYAKGGFAFLNADFKANYTGENCSTAHNCYQHPNAPVNPSNFNYQQSDTLAGWTLGAGVEYALSPSWSVKAEYMHFDFGTMSYTHNGVFDIPETPWSSKFSGNATVSTTVDSVMVGANYHLNFGSGLK